MNGFAQIVSLSHEKIQVIDLTVALVLSSAGPTIRRCHIFAYCSTTVVVCIPRLLSVVVSL